MRRIRQWWLTCSPAERVRLARIAQAVGGLVLLCTGVALVWGWWSLVVVGGLLLADAVWEECRQ